MRTAYRQTREALAAQVWQHRQDHGWTQEQLAERMGVHPKQVQRMEAGSVNVTLATLVAAAVALGATPAELLSAAEPGA